MQRTLSANLGTKLLETSQNRTNYHSRNLHPCQATERPKQIVARRIPGLEGAGCERLATQFLALPPVASEQVSMMESRRALLSHPTSVLPVLVLVGMCLVLVRSGCIQTLDYD